MFKSKILVDSPRAIRRTSKPHEEFHCEIVDLTGKWYRVFPSTAREVFFLQMLDKGINIAAPDSGNGVLVRGDVLRTSN